MVSKSNINTAAAAMLTSAILRGTGKENYMRPQLLTSTKISDESRQNATTRASFQYNDHQSTFGMRRNETAVSYLLKCYTLLLWEGLMTYCAETL